MPINFFHSYAKGQANVSRYWTAKNLYLAKFCTNILPKNLLIVYLHNIVLTTLRTFFLETVAWFIKGFQILKQPESLFSSHWHEKVVFSRQFVDVFNPFIGCQQNWSLNTIIFL